MSTYQINHFTCALALPSSKQHRVFNLFLYQGWIVTGRKTPLPLIQRTVVACPTPSIVLSPVSWGYCVHVRGAILLITSERIVKMILKFTFYGRKTTQMFVSLDAAATISQFVLSVFFSQGNRIICM